MLCECHNISRLKCSGITDAVSGCLSEINGLLSQIQASNCLITHARLKWCALFVRLFSSWAKFNHKLECKLGNLCIVSSLHFIERNYMRSCRVQISVEFKSDQNWSEIIKLCVKSICHAEVWFQVLTMSRYHFKKNLRRIVSELYVRDNCHPFKASVLVWVQVPMWVFVSLALRNISVGLEHVPLGKSPPVGSVYGGRSKSSTYWTCLSFFHFKVKWAGLNWIWVRHFPWIFFFYQSIFWGAIIFFFLVRTNLG